MLHHLSQGRGLLWVWSIRTPMSLEDRSKAYTISTLGERWNLPSLFCRLRHSQSNCSSQYHSLHSELSADRCFSPLLPFEEDLPGEFEGDFEVDWEDDLEGAFLEENIFAVDKKG